MRLEKLGDNRTAKGPIRPATLDDLKALLPSLNDHSVDYLLIGGCALAERATTDIDRVFPANAAVGARLKAALMILSDQTAKDLEPEPG